MCVEVAIAHVEGLVVQQEPDELSVCDIDDRLTGLRIAVTRLDIRKRTHVVDGVEVRPGHAVRLTLVEISPQPEVAVGQREHGLGLRQDIQVQRTFAYAPGLRAKRGVTDHARSSSSARSATTTSAPCCRSASACPTRSTPTTQPKPPARPASTPATASSNTAPCRGWMPNRRAPAR